MSQFDIALPINITVTIREMGGTAEGEIKVGDITVGYVGGSRHASVIQEVAEEAVAKVFKDVFAQDSNVSQVGRDAEYDDGYESGLFPR